MPAVSSTAVQVGTSAAKLFDSLRSKSSILVQNLGAAAIYVGSSTVTTLSGTQVPAGGTLTFDTGNAGPVYAIAVSAQSSPSDTRILIEVAG